MDIIVNGRHCTISDEVRSVVTERLQTVERFRDRVIRAEVQFTVNDKKGDPTDDIRCEITLIGKGPVVRAVALAEDKLIAFDKAIDKLRAQLRKASDRRKSRRGLRAEKVLLEMAPASAEASETSVETHTVAGIEVTGDGPLVVREKEFPRVPLTLAQALDEMELVGHDFFLFVDAETQAPSVVYRRKGYDYGVIRLVDKA